MGAALIVPILAGMGLFYMICCSLIVTAYLLDKAIDDLPETKKKVIHLKDRTKQK